MNLARHIRILLSPNRSISLLSNSLRTLSANRLSPNPRNFFAFFAFRTLHQNIGDVITTSLPYRGLS